MNKIGDKYAEIKAKIPGYFDAALEGVSDGGRYEDFNFDTAQKCIHWNYKKCGYRAPAVIVTNNPLEMQLMFNYIQFLDTNSKFHDFGSHVELQEQLLNQLSSQSTDLSCRLGSILRSKIGSRLKSDLDSKFILQINNNLKTQLFTRLFNDIENQLDPKWKSMLKKLFCTQLQMRLGYELGQKLDQCLSEELASKKMELTQKHLSYLFTTNFYSDYYNVWVQFLQKELKLDVAVGEDFKTCFDLQRRSGICQAILSKELCVVSKYPKKIYWNEFNQLHRINSPAVEWGSNSELSRFDCYFENGMRTNGDKVWEQKLEQNLSGAGRDNSESIQLTNGHPMTSLSRKEDRIKNKWNLPYIDQSMADLIGFNRRFNGMKQGDAQTG